MATAKPPDQVLEGEIVDDGRASRDARDVRDVGGGHAAQAHAQAQAQTTASTDGVEALVALVQRALPGRAVRVDVEAVDPARPRSLLAGGPRFRIEAEGKSGALVVESGPLFTVVVGFAGARTAYNTNVVDAGAAFADIAERVRAFAADELVVLSQQVNDRMLRTTVLRADGDRIVDVVDTGLEPRQGTPAPARLSSFSGKWDRVPSKKERSQIDKLTGGLMGKLKRKLTEKVFAAAAQTLQNSVEKAAQAEAEAQASSSPDGPAPDDGRRRLK